MVRGRGGAVLFPSTIFRPSALLATQDPSATNWRHLHSETIHWMGEVVRVSSQRICHPSATPPYHLQLMQSFTA